MKSNVQCLNSDLPISSAGLASLDSLILGHNHLKQIPARVFSHLTLLNSLELDGNQIAHIDPEAFLGLEGLYNQLSYLKFRIRYSVLSPGCAVTSRGKPKYSKKKSTVALFTLGSNKVLHEACFYLPELWFSM
jgi:Leucine-rich repeat (LRR) protein